MKIPVLVKSFIGYVIVIVLLSVTVLILTFRTVRSTYINSIAHDLENLAIALQPRIMPLVHEQNTVLDRLVKDLGVELDTRITIIDPKGIVLADSERDPASMENHGRRLEIMRAYNGETGQSIRYSRTVKEDMLYVAVPLYHDETIIGVLRVSLFLSDINALLSRLMQNILQVTLAIIVVSLIIAFLYARSLSQPIRALVHASRRVAQGDFDVNVLFKKNDEFRELSDSFNHMVSQIKDLIAALSREKEALHILLSSIQEGIVVLDKKGRIVMSNTSFDTMVDSTSSVGKHYWELIRAPRIGKMVETVLQHPEQSVGEEIDVDNRHFMCSVSYLAAAEQVVLTLHDITDIMSVAKMKKDFVQNVSHELRTPLTAIKGFVETMEEEKTAANKQYLEIIKRHTDRLIHIVKDLQVLSELEEVETIELGNIHLDELVGPLLRLFGPRAQEKNLDLRLHYDKNCPLIMADRFKIEQMFINLIDNAIKYTEKGSIDITIQPVGQEVCITVADTGIGIPQNKLDRIFERFYVIDKSRSRTMGGTGLGLSIVKHIVHLHGGRIEVESRLQKGSKFKIYLPQTP